MNKPKRLLALPCIVHSYVRWMKSTKELRRQLEFIKDEFEMLRSSVSRAAGLPHQRGDKEALVTDVCQRDGCHRCDRACSPAKLQKLVANFLILLLLAVYPASLLGEEGRQPRLTVSVDQESATVKVDDRLFARYVGRSGTKPVVWPIIGPTQQSMTRSYPVSRRGPHEEADHPHHRSLWFGYEGINDIDFWHEPEAERSRPLPIGSVRHREFVRADSNGQVATIATRNDYLDDAGCVVANDERILQFGAERDSRWIDFRLRLWSVDRPLKLADTKEGAFAMRVPGTMKVDAGLGGRIFSSRGDQDEETWGKPAEWVDYSGPVEGATVGIAILTHPSSYQPTPCWHVRPYGLFAANPFGRIPYGQPGEGGFEAPAGEPVQLRYRVLLHLGDHAKARVGDAFLRYAAE